MFCLCADSISGQEEGGYPHQFNPAPTSPWLGLAWRGFGRVVRGGEG